MTNTRALVIGGSSGIGLAVARAAVEAGADVIIASRSPERLASAAASLTGHVETRDVDVTDETSVRNLIESCGELDHLVTSIGVGAMGAFVGLDLDDARRAFDAKFWGQAAAAKHAAPRIRSGGSITFVSGAWSFRPQAGASIPAAMNSAVEGLGRALAVELSPIRVNVVSPGIVDTPAYDGMPSAEKQKLFERVAARLPAKRTGTPADVARAALYAMCSPFVTGSTVTVDGGYSLH